MDLLLSWSCWLLSISVPSLLPFLLFYFVLPRPLDPIMAIYQLWFTEPQGLLKGKEKRSSQITHVEFMPWSICLGDVRGDRTVPVPVSSMIVQRILSVPGHFKKQIMVRSFFSSQSYRWSIRKLWFSKTFRPSVQVRIAKINKQNRHQIPPFLLHFIVCMCPPVFHELLCWGAVGVQYVLCSLKNHNH